MLPDTTALAAVTAPAATSKCYASLVDASSKNTDLLQLENHMPCLDLALCVIDVGRAW
jgi:hypothetical protein